MTDSASARRYVLLSVFAILAIQAYRGKLQTAQVGLAKRLWGVGVLAIMLGLLADIAPTVAGPFSVLIVAGLATKGGDKAVQNALGKLGGAQVPQPTHPGANP